MGTEEKRRENGRAGDGLRPGDYRKSPVFGQDRNPRGEVLIAGRAFYRNTGDPCIANHLLKKACSASQPEASGRDASSSYGFPVFARGPLSDPSPCVGGGSGFSGIKVFSSPEQPAKHKTNNHRLNLKRISQNPANRDRQNQRSLHVNLILPPKTTHSSKRFACA